MRVSGVSMTDGILSRRQLIAWWSLHNTSAVPTLAYLLTRHQTTWLKVDLDRRSRGSSNWLIWMLDWAVFLVVPSFIHIRLLSVVKTQPNTVQEGPKRLRNKLSSSSGCRPRPSTVEGWGFRVPHKISAFWHVLSGFSNTNNRLMAHNSGSEPPPVTT